MVCCQIVLCSIVLLCLLIKYRLVFFFNDTATTEIYTYLHTLSLHYALPIYVFVPSSQKRNAAKHLDHCRSKDFNKLIHRPPNFAASKLRSEEHTSELQSLMRNSYAVFCLKKKNNNKNALHHHNETIENYSNDMPRA